MTSLSYRFWRIGSGSPLRVIASVSVAIQCFQPSLTDQKREPLVKMRTKAETLYRHAALLLAMTAG